jgi:hypothetical protein
MSMESQVVQERFDGLADPSEVFGHGAVGRVPTLPKCPVFLTLGSPDLPAGLGLLAWLMGGIGARLFQSVAPARETGRIGITHEVIAPETTMDFPITEFLDEDACYEELVDVLPSNGLACPRCQARDALKVHWRHRASVRRHEWR